MFNSFYLKTKNLKKNLFILFSLSLGWDSDMSSILVLVHLLPPSSQCRKRLGKISARQACDRLVKFIKVKLLMKQIE